MKIGNLKEINKMIKIELIEKYFELLEPCKQAEQDPIYHPEGNVWVHSFQCLKWALRETNDIDLIIATWFHDIGKATNRLKHAKNVPDEVKNCISKKSLWLIENHMRIWTYLKGEMKKLSKVQELANHGWLPELIQLIRFDSMGRKKNYTYEITPDDLLSKLENKIINIEIRED